MSLTSCLIVMLGGALGTLSRYLVAVMAMPVSRTMPWGTIAINVTGSFIIGFFGTLTLAHGRLPLSENARLFVMVGFCGGYTTFSAFSLQSLDLLRIGAFGRAALNIGASVCLCLLAVGLGHQMAAWLNGGRGQIAQAAIEEEA